MSFDFFSEEIFMLLKLIEKVHCIKSSCNDVARITIKSQSLGLT